MYAQIFLQGKEMNSRNRENSINMVIFDFGGVLAEKDLKRD
jgi:hypothetical protein